MPEMLGNFYGSGDADAWKRRVAGVIGRALCRRDVEIREMRCLRTKPFKVSVDLMSEPSLWRWEIRAW
jgi:hypothetical protein